MSKPRQKAVLHNTVKPYNHRTGNPILTAGVLNDFARGKYNINLVSFIKSRALNQVNIS